MAIRRRRSVRLAAGGFDVRVNIVGFAIDELMLKEKFEGWARLHAALLGGRLAAASLALSTNRGQWSNRSTSVICPSRSVAG